MGPFAQTVGVTLVGGAAGAAACGAPVRAASARADSVWVHWGQSGGRRGRGAGGRSGAWSAGGTIQYWAGRDTTRRRIHVLGSSQEA